MSSSSLLKLKNPHSILAALEHRPKDVVELFLPQFAVKENSTWEPVLSLAREKKVKVNERVDKSSSKKEFSKDGRETHTSAMVRPKIGLSLEEVLENPENGPGVWLVLDQVQDPHNVGAIFRTASFFGVRGILFPKDRAADLTSVVYDIASGGVETVPFAEVSNLQNVFRHAKDQGFWILGTSEHAQEPLKNVHLDRPWVLVVGNEEKGMRRLTEESCDLTVQIGPSGQDERGRVMSLNVSVATGIALAQLLN